MNSKVLVWYSKMKTIVRVLIGNIGIGRRLVLHLTIMELFRTECKQIMMNNTDMLQYLSEYSPVVVPEYQ